MLVQTLMFCPKSWKILFLLKEYKIEFKNTQSPLNSNNKFPLIDNEFSDFSYILCNLDQFLDSDGKRLYGIWINHIDCDFIPNIVEKFRKERVIKPLIKREFTDLTALKTLRINLLSYLKQYSEYFEKNEWLNQKDFSLIDISLSTALAILDYLGEIKWNNHEIRHLYFWYSKIKSRPAFKIVMEQKCSGIQPHATFDKIDF